MWQWINAVLGLWVIAVPFTGLTGTNLMWALVVSGVAISGLALWGALYEQSETHQQDLQLRST
jgi:hypothetical protein